MELLAKKEKGIMNYLLFGTGDYYERYKKWFLKESVLALLDNSPAKQGSRIDGILVMAPEEGVRLPYDVVVILSFYVKEMRRQLVEMGVDVRKIFHFYDLHDIPLSGKQNKREIHYWERKKELDAVNENSDRQVLLLSHDLNLGGPSIALLQVAVVLQRNGWNVVYASMIDGPLRKQLMEENISVVVDENLQVQTMQETLWVRKFSLIFCNTINFHVFLSARIESIPVIWWLHDSEFFYDGVNKDLLTGMSKENLRVVSVGPVPRQAMKNFLPEIDITDLLYGVKDMREGNE